MRKKIAAIVALFIVFTGCYTVIKHPKVIDAENPKFEHPVYFTDDCGSCHQNKAVSFAPMQQPYLPRLNYIHENERWSYFYESPWWNRDIFYQTSGGNYSSGAGNSPLPTTSARSRNPGVSGSASAPSQTIITSGGSSGSSSSKQSGSSGQTSVRQSENSNSSRKATRGSGGSKSSGSKKPTRRKNK